MRCPACGEELTPGRDALRGGHRPRGRVRRANGIHPAPGGTQRLDPDFMSGEARVAEYTGPGDLWLQTRNLQALAGALFPLFPSQQQGRRMNLGKLFD